MTMQAIQTKEAPAAIGPYSQAVKHGNMIFLSGQVHLDPATGQVVTGDIAAQTRRVMENLRAVLAAAGGSFDDVVRTTIYLVDLGHFTAVNEAYGSYFEPPYPARATVQVAALPKGAQVEIDVIAHVRK